ncbi:unnamed protein product [Euphydryas editha]|uniref:Short-chain dehydrogenase/reductase 3 n=1 Tax=Euphydryas editha TaxID=104508 RepID=A0AAU9USF1_EUPED|nr:unnamed protein product [Euphydryas editha]
MRKKNIFSCIIGALARKFRVFQEIWLFPCFGNRKLSTVPLWALDTFVLILKLCSTSIMAVLRTLLPETKKSLYGETVLVTGAGSGIGRELAIQFAELGATVVCWDKDATRNNAVVDEIRKKDGDSFGYTVDVTIHEQVSSVAASIRRLADVTMVVSNAGELTCAPLTRLSPEYIAKLIEVNLLSHVLVIRAFLPSMIERRYGHIVAINSSSGLMPCADMVPYCAAKSGLKGFMDSLSEELRLDTLTDNINTTSVYLGTVSTGLYPTPSHRFVSWYSDISAKEAARIIIEGIRKNKKCICIPSFMKFLTDLYNLMPYRIRIILIDFFNFGHRGWFCFC